MHNQLAMVVVLYGKMLEASSTLQSLLDCPSALSYLLIVNNGPDSIQIQDNLFFENLKRQHRHIELQNQLKNKPLSHIYNDFIASVDADYYVLFDDDTEINADYKNRLFHLENTDIELPKIFSHHNEKQYYPLLNNQVMTEYGEINKQNGLVTSIGSGLIISHKIKRLFQEKNVKLFDPHFALYGVDYSFFRRLDLYFKNVPLKISSQCNLVHAMAKAGVKISAFRLRESIYDEVLTIKYYGRLNALRVSKYIFKKLLRGQFLQAYLALIVVLKGAHPRCLQASEKHA